MISPEIVLKHVVPTPEGRGVFKVLSMTRTGKTHLVDMVSGICECESYRFRKKTCKHFEMVLLFLGLKVVEAWQKEERYTPHHD